MGERTAKEILIIGGGIAGLSTGIYALKSGYKATIIESHDKPGGQLTAWERKGYVYDFCLQWLVGTDHGVYNEIWHDIGAIQSHTEIVNHDIFMKMVDEELGEEFFLYSDLDRWETYLKELAPEDAQGIHKLCDMMKKSVRMEQFENPPGMRSFGDYLGSFFKSWSFFPVLARHGKSTTHKLFQDLGLKNKTLLGFLNKIFGGQDFPALAFIMMMGWQHTKNAGYLKGGSAQMSRRIADTFERLGGKFRFHAQVKEIIVKNGVAQGVILEKNEESILADHIVAACDGHTVLYDMLGGQYLPPVFKHAYEEWPLFKPLVMVGFGIDKTIVSESHNTLYIPKEKINVGQTLVEGYHVMNRSMYDDTLAPKGKTVLSLQFESSWEIWKDLSDTEYTQEKETIKERCVQLLEEHYAGISEHMEVVDLATPRTEVRYTGVWKGAYEGFLPSVDSMQGDVLPMELEGLDHFSMAGQWISPGGGLPPSAQTGRWVIQKLAKKDKRKFRHHVESG